MLVVCFALDWLTRLNFFNFIIGNFCSWVKFFGLVNFVLDFISIVFLMAFKRMDDIVKIGQT